MSILVVIFCTSNTMLNCHAKGVEVEKFEGPHHELICKFAKDYINENSVYMKTKAECLLVSEEE